MSEPAARLLAVDPGGEHVGLAEFVLHGQFEWECVRAYQAGHEEGADLVVSAIMGGCLDVLVMEEFRLRADLAAAQTGSRMETCEMIGAIEMIHRHYVRRVKRTGEGGSAGALVTDLILQGPDIQPTTKAMLARLKVVSEAKRTKAGPHALSAELHGWAYAFRDIKANGGRLTG